MRLKAAEEFSEQAKFDVPRATAPGQLPRHGRLIIQRRFDLLELPPERLGEQLLLPASAAHARGRRERRTHWPQLLHGHSKKNMSKVSRDSY